MGMKSCFSQRHRWTAFLVGWVLVLALAPRVGSATPITQATLAPLASGDTSAKLRVIEQLGNSESPLAAELLSALGQGRLRVTDNNEIVVAAPSGGYQNPETGATVPSAAGSVMLSNRLRRAVADALAATELFSATPATRLAAAERLQQRAGMTDQALIERALARESDTQIKHALTVARARLLLQSTDKTAKLSAIETLGDTRSARFRSDLTALTTSDEQGRPREPDPDIRDAAADALKKIDSRERLVHWAGNTFYGLSLGSVLLLAALGLAITFGLMGVINMAHGEMLMIGAYATYMVQRLFTALAPAWMDWYLLIALPVAFVITAGVGMALERTVIRWLYGRPLETLLATWGISLLLMQAVRSAFGAQNVEVSNPSWMTGGVTVLGDLVLSYNRITIILFVLFVVLLVAVMLNHTRLGLFVRAITQNRRMADCVGVPTGRVDMLAFGLGSGIAGLGGVALSQLGNVGPDLGRAYIVDSFMVVVVGGVGQLAGTVIAAFGLGSLTKFLEPWSGAVLAKITLLIVVILFIQKRPQGLFAARGRSVE